MDQTIVSLLPEGYRGRPFEDEYHRAGPARLPGILHCALYDLGGEGVAYHDATPVNEGAKLNTRPDHQRPHAGPYIWGFRKDEAVDVSYVKDFADLNHPNLAAPPINQTYIGWTADGEWTNYTVDATEAGIFRVFALYANAANFFRFDVNGTPAADCRFPVDTGDMHSWNFAEVGRLRVLRAGRQLLTLRFGAGNNLASFTFIRV